MEEEWKNIQYAFVTDVLVYLAKNRMTSTEFCKYAKIPESTWSETRNLKKPMSIGMMLKISKAIGLQLKLELKSI